MDKHSIIKLIQQIILSETKPIPKGILMEKVRLIYDKASKQLIYDLIDQLIYTKQLKQLQNSYIVEGYINTTLLNKKVIGILSINGVGDGYVTVTDDANNTISYYINNINLNYAINGDEVEINLMDRYNNKNNNIQHAVVSKIINRNTRYAVGTYNLIGNGYEVIPDDKKNYLKIKLDKTDNIVNGHKILMEFYLYDRDVIHASVKKIIGHKNDVGVDILSVVYEYNIQPEFKPEVIDFVNTYNINKNFDVNRVDLSEWNIVTIDPSTSKDLDDAIYVKKENDHFFLSVSIADVSSYVPYESVLDNEAINRATSIYLVDRVIPMLPHKLSNDECSLNEKTKHRTLTCDMKINMLGEIFDINVYPSFINSKSKLSYDQVNDFFENKPNDINPNLHTMLLQAKELHHILRKKKINDGYIDFDIKEPKIIVDENCFPIDIQIKTRGTAQMMIEDFMIAANSAVTIKANQLNIPFIYRTHEKPSELKLKTLLTEVQKTNFKINRKEFENPSPLTFKKALEENKNNPNVHILSRLLLTSMSKAIYETKNTGHFGLALSNYTHFTSPIRRYPDLIVHRLFWMFVFATDAFSDEQRNKFKNSLNQLCIECTEKEVLAVLLERDVNTLKFCQYMSKRIGQIFDATISGVKSFGFFVELDNTIQGLVRIKNLGGDFWIFNENTNSIIGQKTKKTFNFGDKVKVKLLNVMLDEKQINFEVVGYENDKLIYRRQNQKNIYRY